MDTSQSKEKDVEKLFQDAIGEDGGANDDCREVNVGITQATTLSSLTYDELNDDTLLFASEWNLVTEDFGDDEDVLVISQPNSAAGDRKPETTDKPPPSTKPPLRRIPMISSEDDETLVNSDINHTASLELDQSLQHSKLDIQDFKSEPDGDDNDDDYNDEPAKKAEIIDEVEASRRYLTINSAPLYRWSEGMLPSITKQHQNRVPRQNMLNSGEDDEFNGTNSEYTDQEAEKKMFLDSVKNGPSIPAIGESGHPKGAQPNSFKSPWIVERLKHLAKAYNDRTTFVKKAIENLSESETSDSSDDESEAISQGGRKVLKEHFTFESIFGDEWDSQDWRECAIKERCKLIRAGCTKDSVWWYRCWIETVVFCVRFCWALTGVFEPQSPLYVTWLFVMANAFCYNTIIILFRAVFPYELQSGTSLFLLLDGIFDAFYLIDIVWFKAHLKFIENGQWIDDSRLTRKHYFTQKQFLYDVAAILPVDYALWAYFGGYHVQPALQRLSRLNRMLKIDSFWEFFSRIDAITTKFPYLFRIVHTLCYKMYIIHLGACAYYLCSAYEGFGSTPWTYNNEGNAYLRCFYFSFRTTTSIGGRLPKPNNLFERIYMTVAWLLGVFVFAMVIGQIRDIVSNAARAQDHYRDVLDKTSNYMRALNVPQYLQNRTRFWLNFTWELQKTFNEQEILQVLPLKSRTDIALSVHYQTLARVELFKNIDRSVLRDLVLKLRPILFLPGDYVCRKGDVGHEMYIVNKGKIQVLGADGSVLISLGEGCVFGEIAILNLSGFTRRTADVRSVGYSQLFALSKSDLWETLKNYPEYQAFLKKKVQKILRKKRAQQFKDKNEAKRSKWKKKMRSRQSTIENNDEHENTVADAAGILSPQLAPPIEQAGEIAVQIVPEPVANIPPNTDITQFDDVEDEEENRDRVEEDFDYSSGDDEVFGVVSSIEVESIVKERPKTPKLFDAVMEAIRPDSKVKGYFSRSQSISSQHTKSFSLDDDHHNHNHEQQHSMQPLQTSLNSAANLECKIKLEDHDPVM